MTKVVLEVTGNVSVNSGPSCGRYVVANADVVPGTIVAADSPAVRMLNHLHTKTHCWHCLRRAAPALYPCPKCSGVVFCSPVCAQKSMEEYHRFDANLSKK
jgi:hypothetical protein